jgi:hypothetical protein
MTYEGIYPLKSGRWCYQYRKHGRLFSSFHCYFSREEAKEAGQAFVRSSLYYQG